MKKRILSILLALCMLMSLLPATAFAVGDKTFDDVNGHWGQASVERWAGYGVLNGDNFGNFNPDKQMTRAEFATMLANMMGYTAKADKSFGDVDSQAWYADAILKLAAAGVMLGDNNGNANPNKPISRAEAAVMLCRAFNIQPSSSSLNFADSGDVADWAKGSMAALAEKGMMNGVGNNQLAPLANITRASVAKLVDNMVSEYVTESKEITGTVDGIVLVVADAEVTVKDATLNENLIVAPKAEGAEVTITGNTTASDVYVDAAASVKVDAQASAGEVQLSAPKAAAEVAGKADTVTTTAAATEATVTVAKDATVSKVEVAAPNTGLNVAGKVDNVNVASTATGAEVKTESGATVSNVTTSANDVKVSGNGKVENVTANGGTAAVTTPGTKVENKTDSKDNVTNNGKPVEPSTGGTTTPTTPSGGGGGGGGGTQAQTNDRVVNAIFHDTRTTENKKVDDIKLSTGYSVTDKTVSGDTTKVTVNHQNIWQHKNAEDTLGYWTGFAVKAPTDVVADQVKYKVAATKAAATGLDSVALEDVDQSGTANGLAFYFDMASNTAKAEQWVAVQWKTDGDIEYYQVNFTNTSMKPDVDNVKLQIVKNLGDVKALPLAAQKALCLDDFLNKTDNTEKTTDMPWLVVTYNRNVADQNVTFEVSHGSKVLADGFDDSTNTVGTIKQDAAQSWSMNPQPGSVGKLWTTKPDITSGTYSIKLTVNGHNFTATADPYTATGEADAITVTYVTNGGSAVAQDTIAKGGYVATRPTCTKAGYELDGWYTKADFTGEKYTFGTTTLNENTTLYAKWTAKSNTITYNMSGVAATNASDFTGKTYTVETETFNLPTPTAANLTFAGWYTDSAFTEANKVTQITKGSTGDKTFYAKWTADVTITGVTGADKKVTVTYNVGITQEQLNAIKALVPEKAGFAVDGVKDGATPIAVNHKFAANTALTPVYASVAEITGLDANEITAAFGGSPITQGDWANYVAANMVSTGLTKGADGNYTMTGKLTAYTWLGFGGEYAKSNNYYIMFKVPVPDGLEVTDENKANVVVRAGNLENADAYKITLEQMTEDTNDPGAYVVLVLGNASAIPTSGTHDITVVVNWNGTGEKGGSWNEGTTTYTIKLTEDNFNAFPTAGGGGEG